MITTHITINLTSQVSPQLIQAVQGDTGRSICFKLADFTIPAGAAATYYVQKPSGEAIYNSATISGNEITCELTAQSLAEIGENPMQVRISADGEIVTSFDAILLVRPFRGIGAIESSTEMNIFDKAVEQATEQFQENAEQIVEEVIESIPADYTELTDEVSELNERIDNIEPGLSNAAKVALLNCFQHVAWIDEEGQDYYDALESALYADSYPRITAVFNAGVNVIYTDDTLDTLKQYLTVKYFATKESTGTVIASNDYTLSGVLTEGTGTVMVAYDEVRCLVSIPGVVDFYNTWRWSLGEDTLVKNAASVDANQSDTTKYPSRMLILLNYNDRRNFSVIKGKAPYYLKNQNAVASQYYPTPIPKNANHMKITMEPSGQYINFTTNPYDEQNNYYLNDVTANRPGGWQLLSNGVYEKDIVQSELGQLFLVLNAKCTSEGSGYPVEPTNLTIEFSEV